MDDHFQPMGSSVDRRVTKYSLLAALVLGTACLAYGGSKSPGSLLQLDADIQVSLSEFPELTVDDFEPLNLMIKIELLESKIADLWPELDKKGDGYIRKLKAKRGVKKALAILTRSDNWDKKKFEKYFKDSDRKGDGKLNQNEF